MSGFSRGLSGMARFNAEFNATYMPLISIRIYKQTAYIFLRSGFYRGRYCQMAMRSGAKDGATARLRPQGAQARFKPLWEMDRYFLLSWVYSALLCVYTRYRAGAILL
jgi:hypothetical protein